MKFQDQDAFGHIILHRKQSAFDFDFFDCYIKVADKYSLLPKCFVNH